MDLDAAVHSTINVKVWIEEQAKKKIHLSKIYMARGDKGLLLSKNQDVSDTLRCRAHF